MADYSSFLGMSANMGWPLAASKLRVLVFWKSVCGLDLRLSASVHNIGISRATHFFMMFLLRKLLSFCVAGDWISSEGETYFCALRMVSYAR